ncbi:hypothetical protein ACS0TY_011188 [Phlomoides rotata]
MALIPVIGKLYGSIRISRLEMEQSDFYSITIRVRHLRENIAKLQMNYDQLTLKVKVKMYDQHLLWQALERRLLKIGSPSVTQKERVQQVEPQQVFQVLEPGKADSAYTSHSSKEKVHQGEPPQGFQASKPDVSGQPSTSGVKEGEISLRPQKDPKRVDTNIAVVESWHNNPHLKRDDELEIKFITVASEDTTSAIQYPSFHFMQRPDKKAFTYIKEKEMKPELMVNLTEDEISIRRACGVWVYLTKMDKVIPAQLDDRKHYQIYQ